MTRRKNKSYNRKPTRQRVLNTAPIRPWFADIPSAENISPHQYEEVYHLKHKNCVPRGHKSNCTNNPNCLICLGEKEEISVEGVLGQEPKEKEKGENKTGLINLGATCYINSLLQYLFMNKTFRQIVYDWEPDKTPQKEYHEIFKQLKLLFARLQYSSLFAVNTLDFVSSLSVKTSVQQDPQEFFKLFMDLMENTKHFKGTIESLFQGKLNSIVECKTCNQKSIQTHSFTELELPVQGHSNIQECIESYLKEEELNESNQYYCDKCQGLRDATKKIELVELPNVLNLHLLRFVFDPKTFKKKKLHTNIKFPHLLPILNKEYVLSAVLIHRGQTANGGHYVSHIRDDSKNNWWTFDDHKVTPIIELSSESLDSTEDKSNNNSDVSLVQESSKKRKTENNSNNSIAQGLGSTNAYMLIYTLADPQNIELPVPNVSETIIKQIQEESQTIIEGIKKYYIEKDIITDKINKHKSLYKELMNIIHPANDTEEYYFIPVSWIQQWIKSYEEYTENMNTNELLCIHSKLDPMKTHMYKRISKKAWDILVTKNGVIVDGPELSNNNTQYYPCQECSFNYVKELQNNFNEETTRNKYLDLLKQTPPSEESFIISKPWLAVWKKEFYCEEQNMTQEVMCSHNNLSIDKTLYQTIHPHLWQYFISLGYSGESIPGNTEVCQQCLFEEQQLQETYSQRKTERDKLKKELYDVWRPTYPKKPSIKYYIVNIKWVLLWREFIDDPSIDTLDTDNITLSPSLCEHNMLLYDPSNYFILPNPAEDHILLISENSWKFLIENYKNSSSMDTSITITCEYTSSGDIECSPNICVNCNQQFLIQEKNDKLKYEGAEIIIEEKKEEGTTNNGNQQNNVVTSSRRPRRRVAANYSNAAKRFTINANYNDSIQTIKLKIFETWDIIPLQQKLTCNDKHLSQDENTLRFYEILPGDIIKVEVIPEDPEILNEASYEVEEGFKGTGLGNFKSLSINNGEKPWQCNFCTYENKAGSLVCEICEKERQ